LLTHGISRQRQAKWPGSVLKRAWLALCSAAFLLPALAWGSCHGAIVGSSVPVAKVLADHAIVYIGEVVGLKLLSRAPRHNEFATYELTIRLMTTLKGRPPKTQRGTFRHEYYEQSPPSTRESGDLSEVVVSDGGRWFEFGKKVLVASQSARPLGAITVCDQRVTVISGQVLEQVNELLR